MNGRDTLIALIAIGAVPLVSLTSLGACAQQSGSYPTRPIRIITPTPPGNPSDLIARVIGERLGSVFGQPVIVENRPGAGNTIALDAVAKSLADGYTIGSLSLPGVVSPSIMAKIPYDTEKDLAPVALMAWDYNLFAVPMGSPAKSVADFVAMAKARPGILKFSSGGNGTPAHVGAELFKQEAGVDIIHIPYGSAPAGVTALLTGDVDMMIGAIGAISAQIKSGKVRVLAIPALQRIATYPDVPTMLELGYSGIGTLGWLGMVTPSGTPRAVIARLHAEIDKAIAAPQMKERLASIGMEPASMTLEEFGKHIHSELQRWRKVVRDAGIKLD